MNAYMQKNLTLLPEGWDVNSMKGHLFFDSFLKPGAKHYSLAAPTALEIMTAGLDKEKVLTRLQMVRRYLTLQSPFRSGNILKLFKQNELILFLLTMMCEI